MALRLKKTLQPPQSRKLNNRLLIGYPLNYSPVSYVRSNIMSVGILFKLLIFILE